MAIAFHWTTMSADNKQRCSRVSTDGWYWYRWLERLPRMAFCLGCADALETTTLFSLTGATGIGTVLNASTFPRQRLDSHNWPVLTTSLYSGKDGQIRVSKGLSRP